MEELYASKRREVLFLPYKAAMWDCMESVWEAARADKTCSAVVMPIPYAILSKDGIVKEWLCEADKFPPYVPVIDWHTYDVESRHPDIIYIHNPYDDSNRLTQVEPRFFSSNLCKYTDMLVYIPYFALTGMWPEMHLDLPCYEHVDKIIVQSPHYQIINGTFFEEDNACLEDVMPAGKVVALGSPKLDKMAKIDAMYRLPNGWAEKLGRRTTVFYNTTVSSLLIYGKRGLYKMWQVYHVIKRHDDMTFIWRPHPLLESMVGEQHPELMTNYIELKQAMCALPHVIYDDSPYLERAVVLSDAYMGEGSSVVQLFGMFGKPIFYNDMTIGYNDGTIDLNLAASGIYVEGDRAYFWAHYWNALCELDLLTENVRILYQNRSFTYAVGNYNQLVKCDSHIIFPPNNANLILDYNIDTDELKEIPYDKPLDNGNFLYAVSWGKYVIIPGRKYGKILVYDVETMNIDILLNVPHTILRQRTSNHPIIFGKPCILNDVLYVPITNSNQVLSINLRNKSWQIHEVGVAEARYGFAAAYAGNIWLAPFMGGPLAVWNPPTGAMKIIADFPRGFSYENIIGMDETMFFNDAFVCGKYWWLMPQCCSQILRVNLETGYIEAVDLGVSLTDNSRYLQVQKVWGGTSTNGLVYVWAGVDRNIYVLNNDTTKAIRIISPKLTLETAVQYNCELKQDDFKITMMGDRIPAVYEDGVCRTHDAFFRYVKSGIHDCESQKKEFTRLSPNLDNRCGKKIHEYIMKELAAKQRSSICNG